MQYVIDFSRVAVFVALQPSASAFVPLPYATPLQNVLKILDLYRLTLLTAVYLLDSNTLLYSTPLLTLLSCSLLHCYTELYQLVEVSSALSLAIFSVLTPFHPTIPLSQLRTLEDPDCTKSPPPA
jgi:hypothetical protein